MITIDKLTYKKAIFFCWYLMLVAVGMDYLSKPTFLLEIATIAGSAAFLKSRNFAWQRRDFAVLLGMAFIMFGVIMSRLFFLQHLSIFVNLSFIFKMTVFFLFVYLFISRYGFPLSSLYIIACISLPHFIGYLLGLNVFLDGQFSGFAGDPNYLSPDLLAAFCASLVLFRNKGLKRIWRGFFAITFLIAAFLILLTVSRTATVAAILILLFFAIKTFFARKRSFMLKTFLIVFMLGVFGSYFSENISESIYVEKLYDRFFESKKGGDLVENERYKVWGLSYLLINETGLFQAYGTEEFLDKQYRFLSHNSWLDAGIKNGSYTFWSFAFVYAFGLLIWLIRYFKNISKIPVWGIESFLLIFCFSLSFMMFSISVSFMYYYWFILFIVYCYAFFPSLLQKLYEIPVIKNPNYKNIGIDE